MNTLSHNSQCPKPPRKLGLKYSTLKNWQRPTWLPNTLLDLFTTSERIKESMLLNPSGDLALRPNSVQSSPSMIFMKMKDSQTIPSRQTTLDKRDAVLPRSEQSLECPCNHQKRTLALSTSPRRDLRKGNSLSIPSAIEETRELRTALLIKSPRLLMSGLEDTCPSPALTLQPNKLFLNGRYPKEEDPPLISRTPTPSRPTTLDLPSASKLPQRTPHQDTLTSVKQEEQQSPKWEPSRTHSLAL